MIAMLDDCPGHDTPYHLLANFARKLEKHAREARAGLAAIASLPDGPQVFRAMRNRGEIPREVVAVLRELDPDLLDRLEGRETSGH